jgi:hypothetical protein
VLISAYQSAIQQYFSLTTNQHQPESDSKKKKTSSEQVNRFDSSLVATVLSQFSRLEPPKSLRTCFSIIIYGVLIKKMRWLYCLLTATLSASHYKTFGLVYDVLHSTQSIALPFNTEANYGRRQTIIAKFKRYIF